MVVVVAAVEGKSQEGKMRDRQQKQEKRRPKTEKGDGVKGRREGEESDRGTSMRTKESFFCRLAGAAT